MEFAWLDQLLAEMPDEARAQLRQLEEHELIDTHFGLSLFVRNAYLLRDDQLLQEIGRPEGGGYFTVQPDDLSADIVRWTWRRFRQ